MAVSHVRLRHTGTGHEWDCPVGAVAVWRGKGWQPINETTSTPVEEAPPVDGDTEPARKGRHPKGSK